MVVLWIFAGLFLVGAIFNIGQTPPRYPDAGVGLAISLVLVFLARCVRRDQLQSHAFSEWLLSNEQDIRRTGIDRDGVIVTLDTEVVQYRLALSLVLLDASLTSRPFFVESPEAASTRRLFNVLSLTLGWWGFPAGPIHTLGALSTNLRGGERRTVEEILFDLKGLPQTKQVVRLTTRAADSAKRFMVERSYPEGTALYVRPAEPKSPVPFTIEYDDLPPTDGSDWCSECDGVRVHVKKSESHLLQGLIVDFVEGQFTFQRPSTHTTDALRSASTRQTNQDRG